MSELLRAEEVAKIAKSNISFLSMLPMKSKHLDQVKEWLILLAEVNRIEDERLQL